MELFPVHNIVPGQIVLLKDFILIVLSDDVVSSKIVPSENNVLTRDEIFIQIVLLELMEYRL